MLYLLNSDFSFRAHLTSDGYRIGSKESPPRRLPLFLLIHQHARQHISVIASAQVPSLSPHQPHQRHKHHRYNNHQPILTYQHRLRAPDSATFNNLPTTFRGDRPFFSAEVIYTAFRACVDPGFIFVMVGLRWLIIWVGEGACAPRHVIYCLYYP